MASSERSALLTRQHGQAQVALRAATMRDVLTITKGQTAAELVDRWDATERSLRALVADRHRTSSGLAVRYLERFRVAEGITGELPVRLAPLVVEAVTTSLRVTGLYTARRLLAERNAQALPITLTRLTGAVSRQALAGGRGTTARTVSRDPKALGYARVTRGSKPCAFCLMLVGRGPVYKTESSAEHQASGSKYHDHCSCSSEPVYHRDAAWPGGDQAEAAAALWQSSTRGLSGDDAREAFRLAVAGGTPSSPGGPT